MSNKGGRGGGGFRGGKKEVKAPNYKAAAASIDRVKEITFNEHDRKDYLTGFHRRKTERREFALKRIAEKEKREKAEQKKFVKLQRETFQQSIIDSRKKHEKEFGLINSDDEQEEDENNEDENEENNTTTTTTTATIQTKSIKEYSSDDKIVTTTIKPLSFDSDGEEEMDDDEKEDDENSDENSEEDEKPVVKKKLPNNKKDNNKFNKFNKNKDVITADGLKLVDSEKKIYEDEKGRRIKMKKEKGKIIPVVLSEAAETALANKGWKLPRALRTREKKSWSHTVQKKNKKKARKDKKGK